MKNDYGLEGETLKDFMQLARDFHFSTKRKTQLSKQVKNGGRSIEGIRGELELKRKERKRKARKMNSKPKPKSPT